MGGRRTARTFIFVGLAALIASMVWWASYFNLVFRGMGENPPLKHPLGCLLWTSELCAQGKAKANVVGFPEYNALPIWIALTIIAVGVVLTIRSWDDAYPATPPAEPRPIFPPLEAFYAWSRDLSWPIIRIAFGGTLFAYGYIKLTTGVIATFAAGSMAGRGLEPAVPLAYIVFFNEGIGTLLVAIGLFTRFAAASIAIEMFLLTFIGHFPNGFLFGNPRGGWLVPLLWGLGFFAIALRGGGPYSVDRLFKREL